MTCQNSHLNPSHSGGFFPIIFPHLCSFTGCSFQALAAQHNPGTHEQNQRSPRAAGKPIPALNFCLKGKSEFRESQEQHFLSGKGSGGSKLSCIAELMLQFVTYDAPKPRSACSALQLEPFLCSSPRHFL